MAFLTPLFLVGALAAAVPIVLHLLKREPDQRVKFATVHLLQHAPVEHADRRRLRQLILLALRIAAVVLLALAFARPFLVSGASGLASGVTVVALDTSFSLSAPGRFEHAQELAREAVASAPTGHLVGVVTFAESADLVAPPSGDRAKAVAAIDAARAGFGGTRYRSALSVAADAFDRRPGTLVVVTDLQARGWDPGEQVSWSTDVPISVVDVGPLPANLAITAARVVKARAVTERSGTTDSAQSGDRIAVTIRNTGGPPRDVHVRLEVDGMPAGDSTGSVGADQAADVVLPAARGRAARVSIDDPEGIQADNVRYLLLDASTRPSVLCVTNAGDPERDAFYVERALKAAGPDGASFAVVGASGAQLSGWERDRVRVNGFSAIVLLSTHGLDQRGRELLASFAKEGGGILVAIGADVDPAVTASALGAAVQVTALPAPAAADPGRNRTMAPTDVRHPIFRPFAADTATLGLVRFQRIAVVRGAACQTLARFSTGENALVECPTAEGRVLVLASDLGGRWNDFPLHATFVPFLHEALAYLGSNGRQATSFLVGATPPGVPTAPGVSEVPNGPGQVRRIVINVDPREADPARLAPDEFRAPIAPAATAGDRVAGFEARQEEERQNLWRYAILLMIAALVAESLLAAKTA